MADFTEFRRTDRARPEKPQGRAGARWWTMKPDDAAEAISSNIGFWATHQKWRLMQLHRWACFYGNMANLGYPGISLALQSAMRSQFGDQISYNVTGSVVDTLTSKIARNKPRPYFLSDGGDYKAQRLAKNRNKFVAGVFYENETYAKTRIAFRDSAVWGNGIIHVFARNGRVVHERVLPSELFVDEVEAITGDPRQMHRIKFVDRNVLMEAFPDHAREIADAKWKDGEMLVLNQHLSDLVCVRESWHLPSAPDADDGAHVITVNGRALTPIEPYKHPRFPFAILAYTPRMYGFWSQGLVEEGQSIQLEINKVAWYIQSTIEVGGTQKIFLKTGSKVSADHINNAFAAIIEGDDAPQYLTPPLVQPEIYAYVERLIQRYYDLAGISRADASSSKPPGDLSGEALRMIHDIGTERFLSKGQQFEEFHCDIAHLSILAAMDLREEAKERAEEGKKPEGYMVRSPHRSAMEQVDFDDLAFEPGETFYLQCFPVSALPSDPAGRTQKVQEMAQAGWISPDQARELIDFPDTTAATNLLDASRDFIRKVLDDMLEHGTVYVPEPYDAGNIPLFLEQATMAYTNAKRMDVPESRLQLIRDFIDACKAMQLAAQPPAPAGPAVPPANPMPTPTSALVPNVNA
jgi:hypothetical protein